MKNNNLRFIMGIAFLTYFYSSNCFAVQADTKTNKVAYIDTSVIHVYEQEDRKSKLLDILTRGEVRNVLDESKGWLKIGLSGEKAGYIISTGATVMNTKESGKKENIRPAPDGRKQRCILATLYVMTVMWLSILEMVLSCMQRTLPVG